MVTQLHSQVRQLQHDREEFYNQSQELQVRGRGPPRARLTWGDLLFPLFPPEPRPADPVVEVRQLPLFTASPEFQSFVPGAIHVLTAQEVFEVTHISPPNFLKFLFRTPTLVSSAACVPTWHVQSHLEPCDAGALLPVSHWFSHGDFDHDIHPRGSFVKL